MMKMFHSGRRDLTLIQVHVPFPLGAGPCGEFIYYAYNLVQLMDN